MFPTPPPSNPWQTPSPRPPTPPVLRPPMNPPNYTPTSSPYGVPATPGPFAPQPPATPRPNTTAFGGYGAEPPGYQGGGYPPINNPYSPPAPTGGGGPAADLWNGMQVLQRGPGGNVLVSENGVPTAYDNWGNKIPHLGWGYNSADPNAGAAPPPAPETGGLTPATPGVPTPPGQMPNTFYAPTTGSPYLQFGANFLSYFGDTERQQFFDKLRGAGFKDTGTYGLNGPTDFLKPVNFDEGDLMALTDNDNIRQWMRFFLGNLGYGQGYQLPGTYQPGTGLPPAPPRPQV